MSFPLFVQGLDSSDIIQSLHHLNSGSNSQKDLLQDWKATKEYLNHRGTKIRVLQVCFRAPFIPPFFPHFPPSFPFRPCSLSHHLSLLHLPLYPPFLPPGKLRFRYLWFRYSLYEAPKWQEFSPTIILRFLRPPSPTPWKGAIVQNDCHCISWERATTIKMRLSKVLFFLCFLRPTIKFLGGSPVDPLFEPSADPLTRPLKNYFYRHFGVSDRTENSDFTGICLLGLSRYTPYTLSNTWCQGIWTGVEPGFNQIPENLVKSCLTPLQTTPFS